MFGLCVSLCLLYPFENIDLKRSLLVRFHNVQVVFVYQGHRVKVKVTGAKKLTFE